MNQETTIKIVEIFVFIIAFIAVCVTISKLTSEKFFGFLKLSTYLTCYGSSKLAWAFMLALAIQFEFIRCVIATIFAVSLEVIYGYLGARWEIKG